MAGTRNGERKNKKNKNRVKTKEVSSTSRKFENKYAPPAAPSWKPQERAQNDINTAYNPAYRDIDRAVQDAGNSYEEQVKNARGVHKGLMAELGQLPNAMDQYGDISNQLASSQQQVAGMQGAFGGENPMAPGESGAAANLMAAQGGGAQAALAGMAQRQSGWDTSVKQQGAVDYSNRQTNYLEDYEDLLNDLSQQRFDLSKDVGEQLLSRVDQLRDQKFNQGLSLSQYGLNEWQLQQQAQSSRRLQKLIEEMLGEGGGGGGNWFPGKGQGNVHQSGENKGRTTGETAHQEALAGSDGSGGGRTRKSGGGLQKKLKSQNENIRGLDERYDYDNRFGGVQRYQKSDGTWMVEFQDGTSVPLDDLVNDDSQSAIENQLNSRRRTKRKIVRKGNRKAGRRGVS